MLDIGNLSEWHRQDGPTGPSCLPHSAKSSIVVTKSYPRLFGVHQRYYVFCLNPADRNPISRFGQARGFAVTLRLR